MSINQLIAQGGRGIKSPVERFLETKQQMDQARSRQLQEQSMMQTMDLNRQKDQRAKAEQKIKNLAPLAKQVVQSDNPAQTYKEILPEVMKYSDGQTEIPTEWSEELRPKLMEVVEAGGLSLDEKWVQGTTPSGEPYQESNLTRERKKGVGGYQGSAGDSEYERHLMAEVQAGRMTRNQALDARRKRRRVLEGSEMRKGEENRLLFGKDKEEFDKQTLINNEYKEGVGHFKTMDKTIDEAIVALNSGNTGLSDTMLNQVMSQVQDDNVRAYAMYQQFDKPFGNLANRVTESIERFFTGKRSDAEKEEIKSTLQYFKQAYSRPKRQSMRDYYRAMAKDNGVDPFKVVPPESPEDVRDSKIISLEEKKRLLNLYYPGMFE